MSKLNQKAKDIADLNRIERGYVKSSDINLEFKTIKEKLSPVDVEILEKRINEKLTDLLPEKAVN